MLDDRKQDYATTTAHNKRFIEVLKKKLLMSALNTLWGNTDGCVEQYICASELYLMWVFSQRQSIINDRGISEHRNGKEVVDGLNAIDKHYIYQLISHFQLPGSKPFGFQILMHYCTHKNDFSLAKQSPKHLSKEHRKHGVIDQGNIGKEPVK